MVCLHNSVPNGYGGVQTQHGTLCYVLGTLFCNGVSAQLCTQCEHHRYPRGVRRSADPAWHTAMFWVLFSAAVSALLCSQRVRSGAGPAWQNVRLKNLSRNDITTFFFGINNIILLLKKYIKYYNIIRKIMFFKGFKVFLVFF